MDNLQKEAKKSLTVYVKWLNTNNNRKLLSKEQRGKIRELIHYWNNPTCSIMALYGLKEQHMFINGRSGNEELWKVYVINVMKMRLLLMKPS